MPVVASTRAGLQALRKACRPPWVPVGFGAAAYRARCPFDHPEPAPVAEPSVCCSQQRPCTALHAGWPSRPSRAQRRPAFSAAIMRTIMSRYSRLVRSSACSVSRDAPRPARLGAQQGQVLNDPQLVRDPLLGLRKLPLGPRQLRHEFELPARGRCPLACRIPDRIAASSLPRCLPRGGDNARQAPTASRRGGALSAGR